MKEGRPVTDEPLGSHVLELEVADVIEETSDSRSLVFFKAPEALEPPPSSLPTSCTTRPASS